MTETKTITLTVTPDEAEQIVQALAERPYSQVASLIQNVILQAQRQMQPAPQEPDVATDEPDE